MKSTHSSMLVIGGGIAGIQASLDLADQGFDVYLVEREPSIGGRMAQLDRVFLARTLLPSCPRCMGGPAALMGDADIQCPIFVIGGSKPISSDGERRAPFCRSISILAPKMIEVSGHPRVKLLTYSEVMSVDGDAGNLKVKVKRKPRYIDEAKCVGCGECVQACSLRGTIPNEFDQGLGKRGAVYVPFPQTIPLKYVVDPQHCVYLTRGVCGEKKGHEGKAACEVACPTGAINFDQMEEAMELEVKAIIVATGFDLFDPSRISEYGYGKYRNVISALEFERLICASGPTGGKLLRPSDQIEVRSIAFILCVGSRSQRDGYGYPYCSSVCCMYATKEAILAKEHDPKINVCIFYTDLRVFGKGFQEFVDSAEKEWGIGYVRAKPGEIREDPRTKEMIIRYEDTRAKRIEELGVDLVVLCNALIPRTDSKELASVLGIETDEYGFFKSKHEISAPVDSSKPGIFVCGLCQAPKDILDSVVQASGAAARAAELVVKGDRNERN